MAFNKKVNNQTVDVPALSELLDNLHKEFSDKRSTERTYWQHITLIFATVVGFSTVIFSQTATPPNIFIIISLCFMVFGLLIGLFLIKESMYFVSRQEKNKIIYKYNKKMIKKWETSGKITHNERIGLGLASIHTDTFPSTTAERHPKLFKLYQEGLDKLPSVEILGTSKTNSLKQIIQKGIIMKLGTIINIFYIVTFSSFILFLIGILAR